MKKSMKIVFAVVVVLAVAVGLWVALRPTDKTDERMIFYEWGRLYAESLTARSDDLAIQAKDFSISTAEFENMVAQNELAGQSEPEAVQSALTAFIEKRSLYAMAVSEGFHVEEASVRQKLEADKLAVRQADNVEDFYEMIEGANMTEDEYWDSMFEKYQMLATVEAFTTAEREAYLKAGNSEMDTEAWEAYCLRLAQMAVERQNITLAEPYTWELTEENYGQYYWPKL